MYNISKFILNSVYGRFGMNPVLQTQEVVDLDKLSEFIKLIGLDNIVTMTEIGNKTIVSYIKMFPRVPLVNIALATAICANARVKMSVVKNNPDFLLYYTDTDSAITNKQLPSYMVDPKKLGKFKLEGVLSKFVGVGPKVYGGVEDNGKEFTKVKGLKSPVTVSQLE